jgi:hypothetical protein
VVLAAVSFVVGVFVMKSESFKRTKVGIVLALIGISILMATASLLVARDLGSGQFGRR